VKLIVTQLIKKFFTLYGTRVLITSFIRAGQMRVYFLLNYKLNFHIREKFSVITTPRNHYHEAHTYRPTACWSVHFSLLSIELDSGMKHSSELFSENVKIADKTEWNESSYGIERFDNEKSSTKYFVNTSEKWMWSQIERVLQVRVCISVFRRQISGLLLYQSANLNSFDSHIHNPLCGLNL